MAKTTLNNSLTRRSVLRGGATYALALAIPRHFLGATFLPPAAVEVANKDLEPFETPELFAFKGANRYSTAIAVTWCVPTFPAISYVLPSPKVRIHVGSESWEFEAPEHAPANVQRSEGLSVFTGMISSYSEAEKGSRMAVVLELPNSVLKASGSIDIWAEYMTTGSRRRVGAPFLSSLIARDERLAALYHRSSPAEDRDVLMETLATEITERLRRARSVSDPQAHSQRLAHSLVPDVLLYNLDRATGFTLPLATVAIPRSDQAKL